MTKIFLINYFFYLNFIFQGLSSAAKKEEDKGWWIVRPTWTHTGTGIPLSSLLSPFLSFSLLLSFPLSCSSSPNSKPTKLLTFPLPLPLLPFSLSLSLSSATGRLSCCNPNLQTIPRGEEGEEEEKSLRSLISCENYQGYFVFFCFLFFSLLFFSPLFSSLY